MLHLRLTNRMDSVFGVSSIVSLTAWPCVGVQQPAVCMRASGRQQECVSPLMNDAEDTEAGRRAASQGSPAPRGSPASGQIQTPTRRSCPAGLLGFNEEEGGQKATQHWCFLRHPACSAEWMSVRSSGLYLSVILLEQLLCRHSPSTRSFITLSLIYPSPSIYTTFLLTSLLERTPPPPLISDNPDHGDDKLTPASLYLPCSSVVSRLRFPTMPCCRQDAASPLRVPCATPNISDLYSHTSYYQEANRIFRHENKIHRRWWRLNFTSQTWSHWRTQASAVLYFRIHFIAFSIFQGSRCT